MYTLLGAPQVYRPRQPRQSPLWRCLHDHYAAFKSIISRRLSKHMAFGVRWLIVSLESFWNVAI